MFIIRGYDLLQCLYVVLSDQSLYFSRGRGSMAHYTFSYLWDILLLRLTAYSVSERPNQGVVNEIAHVLRKKFSIASLRLLGLSYCASLMICRHCFFLTRSMSILNLHAYTIMYILFCLCSQGMERRGTLLQYFHETGTAKIPAVRFDPLQCRFFN